MGPGDIDTSHKPCLLPGQPPRGPSRNGDHSQVISHVCVHTFHYSPWAQGGQILSAIPSAMAAAPPAPESQPRIKAK